MFVLCTDYAFFYAWGLRSKTKQERSRTVRTILYTIVHSCAHNNVLSY